jgi:hypothetical protein
MKGVEWLTIADAKRIFGKSESTIRAIARELRRNKSKQIRLSMNEQGREIILLNKAHLDSVFVKSGKHEKTDRDASAGSADFFSFMQAQIEIKDKQIEHLSFLLAQAQDEKKQLLLISERPKKRWWLFRRK